jgi:hypothetical protein
MPRDEWDWYVWVAGAALVLIAIGTAGRLLCLVGIIHVWCA